VPADRFSFFEHPESTFIPTVRLRREDTALLVVDVQYSDASADQGFNLAFDRIEPGSMDYFNERMQAVVLPTIQTLLAAFRERDMPVVYLMLGSAYRDLRDVPRRHREWIRAIEKAGGVEDIFWMGNPASAVMEEIAPLPHETIVTKTTWGAFSSSNIDTVLRELGVANLVITGVSTNCCVETTARDAADRGFGCVLVDEGLADYDQAAHDASLSALFFAFTRVVRSAGDVIAAIEEEAHV
jgi:nicotinamidase-related amidase